MHWLKRLADRVAKEKAVISRPGQGPYLTRWTLAGQRYGPAGSKAVFLHRFHRSDPDHLHDHPWPFVSLILGGRLLGTHPGRSAEPGRADQSPVVRAGATAEPSCLVAASCRTGTDGRGVDADLPRGEGTELGVLLPGWVSGLADVHRQTGRRFAGAMRGLTMPARRRRTRSAARTGPPEPTEEPTNIGSGQTHIGAAYTAYQKRTGRKFLTHVDYLRVLVSIGYRKAE